MAPHVINTSNSILPVREQKRLLAGKPSKRRSRVDSSRPRPAPLPVSCSIRGAAAAGGSSAMASEPAAAAGGAHEEESTVHFQSQGLALVGTYTDAGRPGSKAAILCHGLASSRNKGFLREIAQKLAGRGLASLRFDFRGNGGSAGAFKYGNHGEEAEDIAAAAAFLRSRGHAVQAVLGHSKAVTSLMTYAAGSHPDPAPCLVLVSGRFDSRSGVTARFGQDIFHRLLAQPAIDLEWEGSGKGGKFSWTLTKEDMDERMAVNMPALCAEVRRRGPVVLIVHGSEDVTIPVAAADSYARQLPGAELHIVEGACHNFRDPAANKTLVSAAVDFIARTAQGSSSE